MNHKDKVSVLIMSLSVVPLKPNSLQSDLRDSKITTFVLPRLTVSWRCSQKLASASSCCWRPSGLVDIRMRSSAYSSSGTKMPQSSGASMPSVSGRCFSNPSTYNPNSGKQGHPCLTPIRHLKISESPSEVRTAALSCAYIHVIMSKTLLGHPGLLAPATAKHAVQCRMRF